MDSKQTEVILRRFESPDEVREMVKGRFEIVRLGGVTIGRATYQPGWKWSEHVGPAVGASRCTVEHVGLVLSGIATAAFADGRVIVLPRETCSTSRPIRMTVGWWTTSRMCHCIFWGRTTTLGDARKTHSRRVIEKRGLAESSDRDVSDWEFSKTIVQERGVRLKGASGT